MPKPALIIIDVQNDYFPGGKFPLWNTETTLTNTENAIAQARARGLPIILVEHVADVTRGPAPFFNPGTPGVAIHPRILAAAPDAITITKTFADSFHATGLEPALARQGIDKLLLGGMMTQNCVTHTALSRAAEKYEIQILADCCTSVSEMIHLLALNAMSTRIALVESATAF